MLPKVFYLERWLTWLARWLSRSRLLGQLLIWIHRRLYVVNMAEAEPSETTDYDTFAAYFTRRLRPEARVVAPDPKALVSPCDGLLVSQQQITDDMLIQAKGYSYSLSKLIGGNKAKRGGGGLLGGHCITIYLGPPDYHRIHAPVGLDVLATSYIGGRLFAVNARARESVEHLFSRNERLVIEASGEFGPIIMVMVGAQLVSGIHTSWRPEGYEVAGQREDFVDGERPRLERGEEMAYFAFGSTLILLVPDGAVAMVPGLEGRPVNYGEALGTFNAP